MEFEFLGNELDEKTKSLIQKMENELKSKDKEIESKDKKIDDLKNELDYLKRQLLNKNRKIFGKSSEQVDVNQMSLFDEAQKNSDPKAAEPILEEITYLRNKTPKYVGKKDNLAHLERVVIEHKLEDKDLICDKCGNELTVIGKKTSKEVLKYIPAKLYIEEHITYSYTCKPCEAEAEETNIISTKAPSTAFYKTMASNELIAHMLIMKYQHAMPLYRQQNYFKMLGADISRQTMSNWTLAAANLLEDIYTAMKDELLSRNYIQADETTLQVIDDNGKESNSKKYMWLYKSGELKDPIILYDYQKTRSSSCPKEFLKKFSGFLQTDGYTGYNKVENIKRLYCLAHIRRKFHEIIITLNEEALKKSRAIIGFNYCEKLYKIEKDLREAYSKEDDYYKKRYEMRLEKTAPLLDEFQEYVEREIKDALPKSPLGKALDYTNKVLPGMKTLLLDGSLEIDNNGAERAIKPFVIGRKNWLFSNTSKGAKSSATIYSIIETAKANGLIVEKYLVYLFDKISEINIDNKEILLDIMPWSKKLPPELRASTRK